MVNNNTSFERTENPLPQCNIKKERYSAAEIKGLLHGKKIYLWGAGQKGLPFLFALERNGYKAEAFLDSAKVLIGSTAGGYTDSRP